MNEKLTQFGPLLGSSEAATLLKISPATLQRMARQGQVPAVKVGKLWRFRESDLDEWLSSKVCFFRHPCREGKETNHEFAAKVSKRVHETEKT